MRFVGGITKQNSGESERIGRKSERKLGENSSEIREKICRFLAKILLKFAITSGVFDSRLN